MKLPKKARAALAKVTASQRATAVRRAAVDISRDAAVPLAAAVTAAVAGAIDARSTDAFIGETTYTKATVGLAVGGLVVGFVARKNPVVRKLAIGAASGPISVISYMKSHEAATPKA